jgi:hypothetical protein
MQRQYRTVCFPHVRLPAPCFEQWLEIELATAAPIIAQRCFAKCKGQERNVLRPFCDEPDEHRPSGHRYRANRCANGCEHGSPIDTSLLGRRCQTLCVRLPRNSKGCGLTAVTVSKCAHRLSPRRCEAGRAYSFWSLKATLLPLTVIDGGRLNSTHVFGRRVTGDASMNCRNDACLAVALLVTVCTSSLRGAASRCSRGIAA